MKHDWKHLIPHNDNEGPFPVFFCQKCGNFASGASQDSFKTECEV